MLHFDCTKREGEADYTTRNKKKKVSAHWMTKVCQWKRRYFSSVPFLPFVENVTFKQHRDVYLSRSKAVESIKPALMFAAKEEKK